jgi:hypothetical protein
MSVTHETATRQDGAAFFRAGTRYLAAGNLSYDWGATGATTLAVSAAHSNKNSVLFEKLLSLAQEPFDTNSNLYRIGIEHLVPIDRFAAGPTASFLYRDRNGYDAATLQFVPAKVRWAAGIKAQYAATDRMTLSTRLEGVWTREDDNPADANRKFSALANAFVPGSAVPVVSSTGLQAALGVNLKF